MAARLVFLLVVIFTLLVGSPVAAQQEGAVAAKGRPVLVFSTFPSVGFSRIFQPILQEAYGRLGYDARIETMPGERALVASDSGQVDGEAGRLSVIEKKQHNLVRVPTAIYHTKLYVWSKDRNLDVRQGWGAVRDHRLGTLTGYKYVESKTYDMNRVLVPSYEKLMQMLDNDRLDIVILSLFDGLPVLKSMGISDIHALEPPLGVFPMYHYLHLKHEDLAPKVSAVLLEMKKSGRLDEIVRQAIKDLAVN